MVVVRNKGMSARIGIGMYGGLPHIPDLKTAMSFRSQIIGFQDLKLGE